MYALNIDKTTNRILSATFEKYAPVDAIKVESLPEGNLNDWLYYNNDFYYSPIEKEEVEDTATVSIEDKIWAEMAAAVRQGVNSL